MKKWLTLTIGTLLMTTLGLLYAWSIFRAPLTELFPDWTKSQISGTFSISIIMFCIGGVVSGQLVKKIRNQFIVVFSALIMLTGLSILPHLLDTAEPARSLLYLYLCYGAVCGISIGMSYNIIISTVIRWFPGRIGTTSGILLMGYGLGGLILGGLVNSLIDRYTVFNTFSILAVVVFAILLIGSFFIVLPKDTGAAIAVSELSASEKEADDLINYTPRRMVKDPSFIAFFVWSFAVGTGGLIVINSAAPIATYYGVAAVLGLIVSVFNGFGRIVAGSIADRFGRRKATLVIDIMMFLAAVLLYAGALRHSTLLIFIGLPLMGACFGSVPALLASFVNNFYGPKHYSINLAVTTFSIIPSAIIGPILSSKLEEKFGDTYDTTFLLVILMAVITLISGFAIAHFAKKRGVEK
ncbi:MAG: MFS transporter [Clostridiales Family XIII bacterium]|jgi:OFA family oxalate/formate antiporter-like MFS transporter|nr:MFS transporter [Clostridiales Family XIII bacterium]